MIAFTANLNAEIIATTKFKTFDHVWVKSQIAGETHVFACVYFPPDHAQKSAYEDFFSKCGTYFIGTSTRG